MLDTIRVAIPQDAAAVAALVNAAYRPDSSEAGWTHEAQLVDGKRTDAEQIEALIRRADGVLLVGRHHDATVACIDLRHGNEQVTIGLLAVKPGLQNKGVGKAMLAHAEACAVHLFNPRTLVMQAIQERAELMSFYARRGYVASGKVAAYPLDAGVGQPKQELHVVELHKQPDIAPIEG